MTLAELRQANRQLFHPTQDWFECEDFMKREVAWSPAPTSIKTAYTADGATSLPYAATLAGAYIYDTENPAWKRYIWTADVDSHGQRVYVGDNGKGFEIHRHIHLTARFGYPLWQ